MLLPSFLLRHPALFSCPRDASSAPSSSSPPLPPLPLHLLQMLLAWLGDAGELAFRWHAPVASGGGEVRQLHRGVRHACVRGPSALIAPVVAANCCGRSQHVQFISSAQFRAGHTKIRLFKLMKMLVQVPIGTIFLFKRVDGFVDGRRWNSSRRDCCSRKPRLRSRRFAGVTRCARFVSSPSRA